MRKNRLRCLDERTPSRLLAGAIGAAFLFGLYLAARYGGEVHGAGLRSHVAGQGGAAVTEGRRRPNVLVVMTDDQTAESLRVMGHVRRLLMRQGTTFDSSLVSFSLCCPSRATFLTGQYAHNHGVLTNDPPTGGHGKLDHSNTLAVWLRRAGYYTALVGKYLNGYGLGDPREIPPGWDEWYASLEGRGVYRYSGYTLNENGKLVAYGNNEAAYQTDVHARRAAEIIRRRAPSPQPFFLWLAFLAPHDGPQRETDDPTDPAIQGTPTPARRHRDRFASEQLPRPSSFNEQDVSDKPTQIRSRPPISSALTEAIEEKYQQRLETLLAVDEAVARLVIALKEAGELDETLIVFTSDNGFFHGEHRVATGKVLPYESSIRVPLVLRGPGVPRGQRLTQLVANIDLAPTILAASRVPAERTLDGRSLLPLLIDPGVEWGRDLLIEHGTGEFAAIRTSRFLYVEYKSGERELYDLPRDRHQVMSRHADSGYNRVRSELARRLETLRACSARSCRGRPRLALALQFRAGRTAGGQRCARLPLHASVVGADVTWIERVILSLEKRRVARDDHPPFRFSLDRRDFGARGPANLRARVALVDRVVTLDRKVRVCRMR